MPQKARHGWGTRRGQDRFPGPQKRETVGTLSVVGKGWDRGHPPIVITFFFFFSDFFVSLHFFILFVVGFLEVFAAVALGTVAAVLGRLADRLVGREDVAVLLVQGSDRVDKERFGGRCDLRGDLEAVEQESGAAGIDAASGEGVEHLRDSGLDGALVFKHGKVERGISGSALGRGSPAELDVVVAEGCVVKGRGVTLQAAGKDVPTFVVHRDSPTPSLLVLGGRDLFSGG